MKEDIDHGISIKNLSHNFSIDDKAIIFVTVYPKGDISDNGSDAGS